MDLLQNHDYQYESCTREEEEEDCEDQVEEAEQEAADADEEEEANIEEYGLNCFKPSITNSLFPGQRACDQQDLDFLSKIRENS